MYCTYCGAPATETCATCGRRICNDHRRSWLFVTLCTRCHEMIMPGCLAVVVIGVAAVLVWKFAI
jgi:hypothetical protein